MTPISPGSLVRGLYVTFLVIKERNFKDYNIAFFLSFFKYIGYLAFPIQMAYRYPDLARFMAGHWATEAVHFVPVFGEHGALLEHAVFDLFYNYPLTVRRRIKDRQSRRAGQKSRYWPVLIGALAGAALLLSGSAAAFYFSGDLPKWGDIWWVGIFVPFFTAMGVARWSGGAPLSKRLLAGTLSAVMAGLIYAFAHVALAALLPGGEIPALGIILSRGWLPALWMAFLSALVGLAGTIILETRSLTFYSK